MAHARILGDIQPYYTEILRNIKSEPQEHKECATSLDTDANEEDIAVTAYKCTSCPKIFSGNHELKRHKFIHTAVKRHKCGMCHKPFKNSGDLKKT